MCSSAQAAEDTLFSKQQGTGADGQEGSFFFGAFLLEVGESFDDV